MQNKEGDSQIETPAAYCQHITLDGEGIPCGNEGVYNCFRCHKLICGQHVRWSSGVQKWLSAGYCVPCQGKELQKKLE